MTATASTAAPPDDSIAKDTLVKWISHLRELRKRATISALAVTIGSVVAFTFHAKMLHVLTTPYCALPNHYRLLEGRCTLIVTGVLDAFKVTLKLSLWAGILLSSPVWLYQIWRFITPGLYRNERRHAATFVALSISLFCLGAAFAYATLSGGLQFLLGFATGGVAPLLTFDSYLSFITAMVLVFGLSFEFPLLIVMLNLVGVLPAQRLRNWSRYIIFGIVVFAAGATPSQDPFTMMALVLPLCLFFALALGVATLHDRRAARRRAESGDVEPDYAALDDDQPSPL